MTVPPPPQATEVLCVHCGYNLTGVSIGGACPECGAPVSPSFQRSATQGTSGNATACLVLGISALVGLGVCGLIPLVCGPLSLFFYHKARADLESGAFGDSSRGMAIAGLVCGIISTGIVVLSVLGIAAYFLVMTLA